MRELRYVTSAVRDVQLYCSLEVPQHDCAVEAFDIGDVNPNPARFDLKKAEAINAAHLRLLSIDDITHRALPFLKRDGVVGDPVHDADALLACARRIVGGAKEE